MKTCYFFNLISCFLVIYFFYVSLLGIMECNFTQHNDQQCYGALGEPLIFHLPVHGRMTLTKNKDIIFKLVNNTSLESTPWYDKSYKFLRNGIYKFDNTTKTDSGVYQLQVFDIDGREITTININVQILGMSKFIMFHSLCM
uniref:Immunoglobulin V-set domain-containing protein n=1 Tax=Fundulus heteroclitus TaxID=8078 RepID=A0A3Q2PJT1_FUNHE